MAAAEQDLRMHTSGCLEGKRCGCIQVAAESTTTKEKHDTFLKAYALKKMTVVVYKIVIDNKVDAFDRYF